MSKVIIIGAGASGIMATLKACENGHDVMLFDGNDRILKKILITGNGRCNYWNDSINVNKYNTDDPTNLDTILSKKDEVLNYLYDIGLYPHITNGYYYPNSNAALSVRELFEHLFMKINFKDHLGESVEDVKYDGTYHVITNRREYECDKLIIATGSKSYPKTGSTGKGYEFLNNLGIDINPVYPALTKLTSDSKITSKWDGRVYGKITLNIDGKDIISDTGELQLSKNAISGIPTFNVSTYASKNLDKKIKAIIDFLPEIDDLYSFLNKHGDYTLEELFESLLNYKLSFLIWECINISRYSIWNDLSDNDKKLLINSIKSYEINITGTGTYDNSQVCTGGLSLKKIDPNTMEVINHPNLYVIGEMLDADGMCGGFNLAFAFITGYIAGCSL